jgi:hypothetical protein
MPRLKKHLLAFGLLFGAASLPALAVSSSDSSASESLTQSVGSASTSLQTSSDSSTKRTAAADGDYKIVEMAQVAERPGTVRMKLQALAERATDGEFFLYLPQAAVEQGQLAQGRVVTARQRPYGVEFASAQTRRAFFLVLDDDWYRELQTHPVVL